MIPSSPMPQACRRIGGGIARDVVAVAQHAVPVGETGQRLLAVDQLAGPQIPAVQVQQVEQEEEQPVVAALGQCRLQVGEAGCAVRAQGDQLAVEQRRLHLRVARPAGGERRQPIGPVMAVAGHQPGLAALDPDQQAVAVELDLADPARALRRRLGDRAQSCGRLLVRQRAAHRARRGRRFGRRFRGRLLGVGGTGSPLSSASASTPGRSCSSCPLMRNQASCRSRSRRFSRTRWKRPLSRCAVQHELQVALAHAGLRDRRSAPRCRGPRSRPCRRRTDPPGSRPGSRRSRADGPRHARRAAGRPDRARVPCAPPSSTARRHARAGSPSAARRAWPRASAPRTAAPPCPAWVRRRRRLGGEGEVALGAVGPDRGVADRGGFRHGEETCGAGAISTPCPKRPSSSGCEQLDVIGKSRRHAVVVITLLARGGTPWRPRSPSRPAPPSGCRAEAVSECPSPSCADPASAPSPRV